MMNKMILPSITELEFDERKHIYKIGKAILPSVTTVMKPIAAAYYGGIDNTILAAAAKRGRNVHQSIENYLKFGIEDVAPELAGYYEAFKAWQKDNNPVVIDTECRAYHKILRYAGAVDMICEFGDKLALVDFKTSAEIVSMLVRVQLEAYSRIYQSHNVNFDEKAVVHLKKDGSWEMKVFGSGDTEAWSVFGGLLEVHNYINTYSGGNK
jgi:hypothetical protein